MADPNQSGDPSMQSVLCDLTPLAVLDVGGEDAAKFLQGQLSNDLDALAPGLAQYTSYNSPKGRMLANFVLWREASRYRALLPADIAAPVKKRLSMYVLRSKVTIADASGDTARFGIGGENASRAIAAALGVAPAALATGTSGSATVLALPGPRYVVIAPAADGASLRERLAAHAQPAPFDVWRWLTIRAGVPVVTAATQDQFVAQAANWDLLGGISFRKGCYTGQEIIARMQYLGRLKERLYRFHSGEPVAAGARLYSVAFGDQPAGTVVDAAPAPSGGHDLLAVVQIAAVDAGDLRIGAPDGAQLAREPLPYAVPLPAGRRA
jgi:folate-binding protein YgfZ